MCQSLIITPSEYRVDQEAAYFTSHRECCLTRSL